MTSKIYHGWIYVERETGMADHFYVEFKQECERIKYRKASAGACVEFFDEKIGQAIQLETTPLGYRVFTLEVSK